MSITRLMFIPPLLAFLSGCAGQLAPSTAEEIDPGSPPLPKDGAPEPSSRCRAPDAASPRRVRLTATYSEFQSARLDDGAVFTTRPNVSQPPVEVLGPDGTIIQDGGARVDVSLRLGRYSVIAAGGQLCLLEGTFPSLAAAGGSDCNVFRPVQLLDVVAHEPQSSGKGFILRTRTAFYRVWIAEAGRVEAPSRGGGTEWRYHLVLDYEADARLAVTAPDAPVCSMEYERCSVREDCCDSRPSCRDGMCRY